MKENVFAYTPFQYLHLPFVTKIDNYAFGGSKLKSLIVENCECIEEDAFVDKNF